MWYMLKICTTKNLDRYLGWSVPQYYTHGFITVIILGWDQALLYLIIYLQMLYFTKFYILNMFGNIALHKDFTSPKARSWLRLKTMVVLLNDVLPDWDQALLAWFPAVLWLRSQSVPQMTWCCGYRGSSRRPDESSRDLLSSSAADWCTDESSRPIGSLWPPDPLYLSIPCEHFEFPFKNHLYENL